MFKNPFKKKKMPPDLKIVPPLIDSSFEGNKDKIKAAISRIVGQEDTKYWIVDGFTRLAVAKDIKGYYERNIPCIAIWNKATYEIRMFPVRALIPDFPGWEDDPPKDK
jgi:hypothetical protein